MADPSETTQISGPGQDSSPAPHPGSEKNEVLGAIRELSARVGEMQSELHTLRAQTRALPAGDDEASGWDDQRRGEPRSGPDMLTWVRAIDAPGARVPAVPRLLLELVFLIAVAVGVAVAELDWIAIVAVMAGAWVVVAIAELVSARAARRRAELIYAPLAGLTQGYPTDPAWFAPPVERAAIGATEPAQQVIQESADPPAAAQAKLPPPSDD